MLGPLGRECIRRGGNYLVNLKGSFHPAWYRAIGIGLSAAGYRLTAMDFELSDELDQLRRSARRLAQDKVRPRAREIDASGEYPDDLFAAFRDAGLLGLCLPEALGGSGAGILGLTIAIEEVAKYSNAAALMLLLTRLPAGPVLIAGSAEQQQRYLPGIAAGTARAAFGLSEPQAGSDVMGMVTRATPDPDREGGWVLTGTKCWMSGVR